MKNQLLASLLLLTACAADDATPGELAVSSSQSARVIRDRSVDVAIEIVRNESVVGPVTIEVEGLPAGVTALPLEIADSETTGTLKLFAANDIALGEKPTVTVRAIAGDVVAETQMQLRLTDRPGTIDKTFAAGGYATAHYSPAEGEALSHVALQPDGKIVAAGENFDFNVTMVTRFNPDGSIDKDFGDGGTYPGPVTTETVVGVMVRPDGTILVVGQDYGATNVRVLSSTGASLSTLVLSAANTGGDFDARSIVPMPDGSLYILGMRAGKPVVVRLGADLAFDSAFDDDGVAVVDFGSDVEATSMLRRPDGRLVITGFTMVVNETKYIAAQLTADGAPDSSFAGDGTAVYDMLPTAGLFLSSLQADGRVAAVSYDANNQTSLVLIETNGTIDMSNAVPMPDVVPRGAISVTGGTLVVGGNATANEFSITKFASNGALDTGFGTDGTLETHAPTGGAHLLMHAVQLDEDRAIGVGANLVNDVAQQVAIRFWL